LHIDHGSSESVVQLGQTHGTLGRVTLFYCHIRFEPHRDEPEQEKPKGDGRV
jgi:hypothetical protein